MTTPRSVRLLSLVANLAKLLAKLLARLLAMVLAMVLACAAPARAQSVGVMINGEPITEYDIEPRTKLNFLTTHNPSPRHEGINELIDEKVEIKEAKKFGVDPTSSDIDQAYEQMSSRMHVSADQLTKSLESQGI